MDKNKKKGVSSFFPPKLRSLKYIRLLQGTWNPTDLVNVNILDTAQSKMTK